MESFKRHSFEQKIANNKKEIEMLLERFARQFEYLHQRAALEHQGIKKEMDLQVIRILQKKELELTSITKLYENANPKNRNLKGYAQVVKNGKIVPLGELIANENFELQDTDTRVSAKVMEKTSMMS
jgi:exonuclease VII large subunit